MKSRLKTDPRPGSFPTPGKTLRAQVLEVLLASQDMTGCESIFDQTRVNLNTVVRALMRKYHWPIERRDFPVNIGDGRSGWASTWCLAPEVIAAARAAGGDEWLESMAAIRAARNRR